MPLREDLLESIAGENPSGANLYYDKIFDQIKEARTEDDDSGSAGAWERVAKKADHALVIKLASETLAKRSKDLRLAGWLIESHVKREGIPILPGCLDLLWKLQEGFWETIYPEIDDDGDLGLRVSAIEGIVHRLAAVLRQLPITRAGYSASQYTESRRVGYEESADNSDKRAARQDAIDQGQITAEDFDTAFAGTGKAAFLTLESALLQSEALLESMGLFHEERYGEDYPGLNKLAASLQEVRQVVSSLLQERRKTDPDPVEALAVIEEEATEEAIDPFAEPAFAEPAFSAVTQTALPEVATESPVTAPVAAISSKRSTLAPVMESPAQAQNAVLEAALFLLTVSPESPVPYLLCAGLRLGETRAEGSGYTYDFPTAPSTATRQALRRLSNEGGWTELLQLGLRTLAEPSGRLWLDLHRMLWKGAAATGANALATCILSTVRGLLQDLPALRTATLDDDTPAANPETQQWIDTEILPPVAEPEIQAALVPEVVFRSPSPAVEEGDIQDPDLYEKAKLLLHEGHSGEAIALLSRDAALQPSGRQRFTRRVQVAELCLAADHNAIAYPLLLELSTEIDRRGLETWEHAETLAQPLGLLLRCLQQREAAAEDRDPVFERLCRLDPHAALAILQQH